MLRIPRTTKRIPVSCMTPGPSSSSAEDLYIPLPVDERYKLREWEEWSNVVLGDEFEPEVGNSRGIIFEYPGRRRKVTTDDVSSFQHDFVCHWCRSQFENDEDLYEHIDLPHSFVCDCGYRFVHRLSLGLHMKEHHGDILKMDNCPKCNANWTKTFKRKRRTNAVVRDACSIGEHWGSAHAGKCPTCNERNFVDGQAVYKHRLEAHSEENLLGICASKKCQEPIAGLLKTPTGLGY